MKDDSRINEWYVPKFGPMKFRLFIGLLFLPYTGMCVSFVIMGALLSPITNVERLFVICIIYFMSLGIAAHIADNIGSKKIKPWQEVLSKKQSWILLISSLTISYILGFYYIIYYTPLLLIIAVLEGFFLFAYNFEMVQGFFHNDFWFSISWGILPFMAGVQLRYFVVYILFEFLMFDDSCFSNDVPALFTSQNFRRTQNALSTLPYR